MEIGKSSKHTIVDVARRASVSVGTVSHVLNGTVPVSETRRARVLAAIAEMGFTRNLLAQGLRAKTTPLIGICVPRARLEFFSVLTETFDQLARTHGYETLQVLSPLTPEEELQQVKSMMKYKIGGLVLLPSLQPQKTLAYLRGTGLPTVIIDRPVREKAGVDQVTVDNRGVMGNLLDELVARGHLRVLFVYRRRENIITVQRFGGIGDAAARHAALTVDAVGSGDDPLAFIDILRHAIATHEPTAIIASNSYIAEWAVRAFRVLGTDYPAALSLVAIDEPAWADIVEPPLSIVRQPAREMAKLALESLIDRITGADHPPRHLVLPAEIVIRASVRDLTAARSGRKSKPRPRPTARPLRSRTAAST